MKSKRIPFTANLDAHMLSELVEKVKQSARHAAMERYLNSDAHAEMIVVDSLVELCEESERNLLKGVISPHLDVCCCAGTFVHAMSLSPYITYEACELPGEDGDEDVFIDEEIDDAIFARLNKLSVDRLRQKLIADYSCLSTEYAQAHEADEDAQRRYHEAVFRRFEAAAKYAKAIGSESARLWLEAICLISPNDCLKSSDRIVFGLELDSDCVAKAYEVAERAQRALWVDDRLRQLPAAKLPRKPRR